MNLSELSNQELGDIITNGETGSQLSRNTILELTRRDLALKSELKYR